MTHGSKTLSKGRPEGKPEDRQHGLAKGLEKGPSQNPEQGQVALTKRHDGTRLERDANRRLFRILAFTMVALSLVVWTLQTKFALDSRLVLGLAIAASLSAAWLCARRLEENMNHSADFIIHKLRQVRSGDLTPRFSEDPDDLLPAGLNHELGETMGFLRGSLGDLWRTSALLARRLDSFTISAGRAFAGLRESRQALEPIGTGLEALRASSTALLHRLARLGLNGPSDREAMEAVERLLHSNAQEFTSGGELLRPATRELEELGSLVAYFQGAERDFSEASASMENVSQAIADASRQASLVALNAGIDSGRAGLGNMGPYAALSSELGVLSERLGELALLGAKASARARTRMEEMEGRMRGGRGDLSEAKARLERTERLVKRVREAEEGMASLQVMVSGRVDAIYGDLGRFAEEAAAYDARLAAAIRAYDAMSAALSTSLMGFERLEMEIGELRDGLRKVEAFRQGFRIG